jgi:hypothetical protein
MLREEKHVNITSKRLVVLITFSFINILPRFLKRNETKRNETKRNETKRNETVTVTVTVTVTKMKLSRESHRGGPYGGGFSVFYEPWLAGGASFGEFGGGSYLRTCCIKPRVIRAVLELGGGDDSGSGDGNGGGNGGGGEYGVWFSDPDVAFLRDPAPWWAYGAACDLQYQINHQNKVRQADR